MSDLTKRFNVNDLCTSNQTGDEVFRVTSVSKDKALFERCRFMDKDFLTRLEHAGGQGALSKDATLAEREALAIHLTALRKFGHAIACDEVMESGEMSGEVRIIHYLTCRACAKGVL